MARVLVHINPDDTVRLEAVAPNRPAPPGTIVDSADIPGKQQYLKWDGSKLVVDPALKAAWEAIDRRHPLDRLLELLEGKNVITPKERGNIRGG